MKNWIGLLACLWMAGGCGLDQKVASTANEVKADFQEGVRKEAQRAIPKNVQDTWDYAQKQGPEMVATVKQTSELAQRVLEGQGIGVTDQKWIQDQLKNGGENTQKVIQPLVQMIGEKLPESRDWALKVVREQEKSAPASVREGWRLIEMKLAGPSKPTESR